MKIKAFSFEKNSFALATVKQNIVSNITESGVYFESISDANTLFNEISAALENSEVLLIGVENSFYLKFKPVLIKAFDFTPAYSEKIKNAIGDSESDEKLIKAHSLVPNECTELISEKGLYSGFYVKSEGQFIVVFPLISDILPKMLTDSDLPFIKKPESKTAVYESIAEKGTASSKARDLVEKLIKNDIKIAIPTTPAAKTLKEDIKECGDTQNNVFFTPFVNDDGINNPKQYAAQLAKGAMDLRNSDLGAAITNIFREKKGESALRYYSFISVATNEKTVVKKLFADADENIDNLIIEATSELYSMIDKYADETAFKKKATAEEKEKYEKALIEAEYQADSKVTKSRRNTVIAIITLAVAVAVCILFCLKSEGYFVSPSDAPEADVLQAGGRNDNYTAPVSSTNSATDSVVANNTLPDEMTEFVSTEENSTSIFDVVPESTLTPIPETGNPVINYTPNNNRTESATTKKEETTTEPTTKKAEPKTTEPQTTQKETETEMEIVEF